MWIPSVYRYFMKITDPGQIQERPNPGPGKMRAFLAPEKSLSRSFAASQEQRKCQLEVGDPNKLKYEN